MPEYTPMKLQSFTMFGGVADRPSFVVKSGRYFRLFFFRDMMLFLDLGKNYQDPNKPRLPPGARVDAGAALPLVALFGALGGLVGGAVLALNRAHRDAAFSDIFKLEEDPSMLPDDQIIELARRRRHSFVLDYEHVKWAKLGRIGALASVFAPGQVGTLDIRERSFFVKSFRLVSDVDLATAARVLPERLGDKARVQA